MRPIIARPAPSPARRIFGRGPWSLLGLGVLLLVLAGGAAFGPGLLQAEEDSCVWCHKRPEFKVTNKKLFDYYQQWEHSLHAQAGITCVECHGGNSESRDKEKAHGAKRIGASERTSPVFYQNIPRTCAQCHEDVYDNYRKSNHFKHLTGKDQEQGPNCVTCHASVNTTVLNVNTVRETCQLCHNKKTGNHPAIPGRAETVLGKFLSINRFVRYLSVRGGLLNDPAAVRQIENQTEELMVGWHTFELDAVEHRTDELLTLLKKKRNEIRKRDPRNK